MAIGRFWSMGFLDWSSDSVCKGRWETVTSFPKVGSDSWTYISQGTTTFFLEYTLPIIQFSRAGSMDNSGSEKGTNTGSNTLGGSIQSMTSIDTRSNTLGGSIKRGSMK